MHADALGADALDGAPLACLGYERCAALLLPLLLPLPVAGRCGALAQLQSKLSSQLLAYLGTSLERVLESERGCQVGALRMRCACCAGVAAGRRTRVGVLLQRNERHAGRACANIGVHSPVLLPQRFCRLPFEVGHWLLEHGPCDRGETRECWWHTYLPRCVPYISHRKAAPMLATVHRRMCSARFPHPPPPPPPPVFDLANLWLEQRTVQQRAEASERQQAALAALPWRRPLAADFLRCMEANLDWAAQFVARSPLRPPRLPPSLDGRFSFTAEVCTGKRLHGQRGSACTDALPWHAAVCSPSSKYRYQPCPACVPCL